MSPTTPLGTCAHCGQQQVVVKGWLEWGDNGFYFAQCLACGFKHTAIEGPEEQEIESIVKLDANIGPNPYFETEERTEQTKLDAEEGEDQ